MEKQEMAGILARGMLDEYETEIARLKDEGLDEEARRLEKLYIPSESEAREMFSAFISELERETDIMNLGEDELDGIGRGIFHIGAADDRDAFRILSSQMSIPDEIIDIMEKGVSIFDFSRKPESAPRPAPKKSGKRKS